MKKITGILLTCGVLFFSCVKKDYDEPASSCADPDLTANASIAQLKSLYTLGSDTPVLVTGDTIIAGIVVADDRSGNFYKNIILQDSSGGIAIRIDVSGYYTEFPVGRRIFVKCKGLYLGEYNGLIQMGGYVDNTVNPPSVEPIPVALLDQYFFKGACDINVTPKVISISQLNNSHQNMLIQLDSVEFISADVNQPYADAANQLSVNRTIEDCFGNTILLRTSGFASFANSLTPSGRGNLVAIYQIFGSDKQLYIRDLNDVMFSSPRCGAITSPLTSLNENFSGVTSNQDLSINGWVNAVISGTRYWQGNSFGGNSFAQATAFSSGLPSMETWLVTPPLDLSAADTLAFESAQAFWVHDGLSIWISTDFDGINVSSATWTPLSCTLAGQSNNNYDWVLSGDVVLTGFTGTGYIGFKYSGNTNTQTTTYRIDNVSVH